MLPKPLSVSAAAPRPQVRIAFRRSEGEKRRFRRRAAGDSALALNALGALLGVGPRVRWLALGQTEPNKSGAARADEHPWVKMKPPETPQV